ncbi:MAG: CHAD domain-containing protein [Deltaproteobacteria bacterium]|nr:CHAD domain-containing protein [Deltaproteobacteria bacterium]
MKPSAIPEPVEQFFLIPSGAAGRGVLRDLRRTFALSEDGRSSVETQYHDTFDGRLFARARALRFSQGELCLECLDPPGEVARAAFTGPPDFAHELPPGALQDALRPLAGNRALLPLFSLRADVLAWRLTNREQKTVLRVALLDEAVAAGARSERLGCRVAVRQVRGYKKAFREVCEWWAQQGIRPEGRFRFRGALEALDLDPVRTASLSRTPLTAAMPASDAVRAMLHAQYRVARANEEGMRNDTDAEFLHDFRVAVRRARSFLGQLRDVFDPAPAAELRKSLSRLGRSTNALRDLDVYLEHRKEYQALLSDPLAGDLAPLFDHVARSRAAAQREVTAVMRSAAYRDALERWRTCVEEEAGLPPGRRGAEPVAQVVGARVARQCRSVLEQGYAIPDDAAPDALHSLRIECKQLRYLTEILTELSPEVRGVVPRLKKLQDALGRIQDLTVHEARTRDFARALSEAGADAAPPAIEVLVSRMRAERDQECATVRRLFVKFSRSLRETEPPYALLLPWLRPL